MVRGLNSSSNGELDWMGEFAKGPSEFSTAFDAKCLVSLDFRRRFLTLLSYKFREFGSVTSLSMLEAADVGVKKLDDDKAKGIY